MECVQVKGHIMLWLCRGHRPRRIEMSASHRYWPEHLIGRAEAYLRINQNISLEVGEEHLQLSTLDEIKLAATLVASYHNQYVCTSYDYEDVDWISDCRDDLND